MNTSCTQGEFYHVNRRVPWSQYRLLAKGDEVLVGAATNPFFAYYETTKLCIPVKQPDGTTVQSPAMTFLRAVKEGRVQCPMLPENAQKIAQYFVTFLREVMWEDVRRMEFPYCPSRQRCMWLVHTQEQAKYWVSRLGCPEEYQIVKVLAQGRVHVANELFLLGDSATIPEITEKARLYWLGMMPEGAQEEMIFEGLLRVLEVVESKTGAAKPCGLCSPERSGAVNSNDDGQVRGGAEKKVQPAKD
jgi:hypothetical protein